MAARVCNADRLVQRVTVFISEFIRGTYGFLTPQHVEQLRNFRNEVEDNFPSCPPLTPATAPWKDRKSLRDEEAYDSESEEDFQPITKKKRHLPESLLDNEQPSMYKEVSSPATSEPFATPSKKTSDSEWTGSNIEENASQ